MARPRSDVYKRFEEKVLVVESGCHEWQSTIKPDGYGRFHHDGRGQPAHRVAYQLYKGAIPDDLVVMHLCDNRACVNPAHLQLGTTKQNVEDMDAKGRRNPRRKLSDEDVKGIRRMLAARYSQEVIAQKYGVHQGTVSKIKLGKVKLSQKL